MKDGVIWDSVRSGVCTGVSGEVWQCLMQGRECWGVCVHVWGVVGTCGECLECDLGRTVCAGCFGVVGSCVWGGAGVVLGCGREVGS